MRGLCGLGLNFPTFILSPSARQKQADGGSLKDATACRQRLEPISFLCRPIGDPWALGQGFTYCHKARVEELVATFFSVQDDWFWKILWSPFVGFPSRKPEPSSNGKKASSKSQRGWPGMYEEKSFFLLSSPSHQGSLVFLSVLFSATPLSGVVPELRLPVWHSGAGASVYPLCRQTGLGKGCTVQPDRSALLICGEERDQLL